MFKTRGATVENIMVPFCDGKKQIGVVANLAEGVETKNARADQIHGEDDRPGHHRSAVERTLARDGRPEAIGSECGVRTERIHLLIYKFEGFELFKRFIAKVNEDTISFLLKADIPVQKTRRSSGSTRAPHQGELERTERRITLIAERWWWRWRRRIAAQQQTQPPACRRKVMPVKSDKLANRNDKVSVQYTDGRVLRDVKYKKVEDDILNNRCIIID